MLKIPHVVCNSNYVSGASTGALPHLFDPSQGVLVGRCHPGMQGYSYGDDDEMVVQLGSDIVSYLYHVGYDLDSHLSRKERNDCVAYSSMVKNDLQPFLLAFRFGDRHSYESTYKNSAFRACSGEGLFFDFLRFFSKFQVWSEKQYAVSQLRKNNNIPCSGRIPLQGKYELNVPEALKRVSHFYSTLDSVLANQPYLINSQPCSADAMLYSHLCEALSNVHLYPVVQKYSNLINFYSLMHNSYFNGKEPEGDVDKKWIELTQNNDLVNRSNLFYQPLLDKLSIIIPDLKIISINELAAMASNNFGENWERFRMGGTLLQKQSGKSTTTTPMDEQKEKTFKKNEENDSMWWSGVVFASALFLASLNSSSE